MLLHYITPLIATECVKEKKSALHITPIYVVSRRTYAVPLYHLKERAGGMSRRGLLSQGLFNNKCFGGLACTHYRDVEWGELGGILQSPSTCLCKTYSSLLAFFLCSIMSLKANAQSPEEHRSLTEMLKQENSSEDAEKKGW